MAALPSDERPELERGCGELATVRCFDVCLKNRIFGKRTSRRSISPGRGTGWTPKRPFCRSLFELHLPVPTALIPALCHPVVVQRLRLEPAHRGHAPTPEHPDNRIVRSCRGEQKV